MAKRKLEYINCCDECKWIQDADESKKSYCLHSGSPEDNKIPNPSEIPDWCPLDDEK